MTIGYKSAKKIDIPYGTNDVVKSIEDKKVSYESLGVSNYIPYGNLFRMMTDEQLRELFEKGDIPTNDDFIALIDSKLNKSDAISKEEIESLLEAYFGTKADIALEWYTEEMNRRSNEAKRVEDEAIRVSNEDERKNNFASMQTATNDSLANVDKKMATVETDFNHIKATANEKVRLIDTKVSEMNALKEEVVVVKNNTESTRLATEEVKTATNQVKIDTETVKNETLTVKTNTEAVRIATDKVKNDTLLVKGQAEDKIVNVENRMKTIEGTFDELVGGTGYATKTYVDENIAGVRGSLTEGLSGKANKVDVYTKAEVDIKIDNVISGGSDKNIAYGTTVAIGDWLVNDLDGHYVDVVHELATKRFTVEIVDTDTNEKVLEDYRIIDDNTIRVRNDSAINAMITVINGNAQTEIIAAHIDDVNVSAHRTFSSNKITEELNKKSNEGHTHTKNNITDFEHTHAMSEITGLELSSSKVNRPNGSTVEASLVANETSISLHDTKIANIEKEIGINRSNLITEINSVIGKLV